MLGAFDFNFIPKIDIPAKKPFNETVVGGFLGGIFTGLFGKKLETPENPVYSPLIRPAELKSDNTMLFIIGGGSLLALTAFVVLSK